jgi:signal transduction histidine kinase
MTKKINLRNGLFLKISLAFLGLFSLLGLAYVLITAYAAKEYYRETTQRLNAHVASHMLKEVSPFEGGKVNEEAVGKIMHSMMAVNPSVEVYLLSPGGEILSFVVLDKKVRLKSIGLGAIQKFIQSNGTAYVLGDDPRNPGQSVVFSASEVRENDILQGYVYLVLASEEYENASQAVFGSYFLKVGSLTFVVTLLAAFLIGLVIIYTLTKSLRKLQRGVQEFQTGNYHSRVDIKGTGEMADLAANFNFMADTILQNIEKLKEVDSLRRDLIANVSHDLRSPMAVIHGYIETLVIKEDSLTEQDRQRYLNIILQSSEKLKKLVADLFELSRLEAKQIELKREPVFITELLKDTIKQFELLAADKEISLHVELPEKAPHVMVDVHLINRVLVNLLDNAIKYTPAKGRIDIAAGIHPGNIRIRIRNSGEGIATASLPQLFDRYYTADQRENAHSTGLGLAIAKKIMDLHDSHIWAESIVGESTTFGLDLSYSQ